MAVRLFLAKIVWGLHILCIFFLVLGFLLPKDYLLFHALFLCATIVQWWVNSDQCVLTQLQFFLEGKKPSPGEEGQFIKSLLEKFGLHLSRKALLILVYGILLLALGLSLYRYWN